MSDPNQAILGVILGTAMGDALGLPHEGLSARRVAKRLGDRPLRHSLVLGRGMVSDDTEHTCMVALALIESRGEPERFARALARRLQVWLLTLPPGIGWATLRGIVRLFAGWSPARSGVRSAGNGPAMRAALLGVVANDPEHLAALVRASTRLTHSDPRAEQGAWLVATWARLAARGQIDDTSIRASIGEVADISLRESSTLALELASTQASRDELARALGCVAGVSGFVVHTLPAALYCWLRHRGDPRAAIEAAVRLGGDTDTVAAIVGALVGAELGASGLPADWIAGIRDWPFSTARMRAIAGALAGSDTRAPRWRAGASLLRNLGLLCVVLVHLVGRVRCM